MVHKLEKPISCDVEKLKIGIVQTSLEKKKFPHRYLRAIEGVKYLFGKEPSDYTWYTHDLGNEKQINILVELFHKAIDECNLLISLTGGYTSNCLLTKLDYSFIAEKKPIITGYSDTTAILLGILAKAGVPTIYGPALLGAFGEWPQINMFTGDSLKKMVFQSHMLYEYTCPSHYSESNYFWDVEDNINLHYEINDGWKSNSEAIIEGPLIGGNLNTFLSVINTEYCPELTGSILCLEDAFTSEFQFMRDLESMVQKGVFSQVSGVVFGKFFQSGTKLEYRFMQQRILDTMTRIKIPVMVNVDFGHCSPMMSLPLGIKIRIDYGKRKIKLLESFCDLV